MKDPETRRTELELELLEQDIRLRRREAGWFGKLTVLLSTFSAAGALIAALVAYSVAKSTNAEKLVKIYETKAEYYAQKDELRTLNDQIHSNLQKQDELEKHIKQLQTEKSALTDLLQAASLEISSRKKTPTLMAISVSGNMQSGGYYIDVSTEPSARVSTYFSCQGKFVFPTTLPNLNNCAEGRDRGCDTTPCKIGPFGTFGDLDRDLWVVAQFGDHQEIRYVNLDIDKPVQRNKP
ncbi:MAG: hypothetical protein OEV64_15665 [Desulfobulbaceae bacterium]|nr:hypothetical protein [Desulfobulbaceae bacterium]